MRLPTPSGIAAFAALAVATAGCGSNEPRPVEELTRARVLIAEADRSGARQYASGELQSAREQLRRAEAAVSKDTAQARRLAVQASLDAELAAAKSRSGKAESAAEEIAASVASLRQEAGRGAGMRTPAQAAEPQPSQEPQQPPQEPQPPQGEPR